MTVFNQIVDTFVMVVEICSGQGRRVGMNGVAILQSKSYQPAIRWPVSTQGSRQRLWQPAEARRLFLCPGQGIRSFVRDYPYDNETADHTQTAQTAL